MAPNSNDSAKVQRVRWYLLIAALIMLLLTMAFGIFYFLVRVLNPSTLGALSMMGSDMVELEPVLIEAQDVTQLEVYAGKAHTRIAPSQDLADRSVVRITESYSDDGNEYYRTAWTIEDGVLRIDNEGQGESRKNRIAITIDISPSVLNQLETVDLECANGQIDASGLDCGRLRLEASSGIIKLDNSRADDMRLVISSGDAELSGTFDEVALAVSSGHARLVAEGKPSHIACDVSSGDIILSLPRKLGFTAWTNVSSGSVSFDQRVLKEADNVMTYGDGLTRLNITVGSGSLKVTKH